VNIKGIIIKVMAYLLIIGCVLGGCSYLNKKSGLDDDNAIEEAIEDQLEEHLGISIDLSPDSPER
tara:strand:- start:2489 stop:2683 length:195 start_codon:yes stop_codon:yes gene_type:complete